MSKQNCVNFWDEVYLDKRLHTIIEHRFYDVYRQDMMSNIHQVSRGYTYQHLVDSFCMQYMYYALKPIDDICKKYIARFRMSSHCLNIKHDRYRNELRENR